MRVRRIGALCWMAVTIAACNHDSTEPPSAVLTLAQQGGDGQSGPAGSLLALPLQAEVKDATGQPVAGVLVDFARDQGSTATLSDSVVASGADGVARVQVRLGPTAGTYHFAAFLPGKETERVEFTSTATAPPTLTALSSTSIQASDTITLTGTDFNSDPAGNVVFFGQAQGRVLSAQSATTLQVTVPPCVAPGTVLVRVEVGSASTNTLPATYNASTPGLRLAVGEGITVSGAELGSCLTLLGNGADYLVVPQLATGDVPRTPRQYLLGDNNATAAARLVSQGRPVPPALFNRAQSRLDLRMREFEHEYAPQAAQLARSGAWASLRPLQALALNSTRNFHVLSSLDDGPLTFKAVTGRLRFIGDHVLIYVDVQSSAQGFTDNQLQQFGRLFDNDLYAIDRRTFGTESDVDQNGHVVVLMTPVVNALTPASTCATQGFITGFFFSFDLSSRSSNSNQGEVFYSLVPDPSAESSCAHSIASVESLVPSTFIHEFQHMISFNQHVLVRGGDEESTWLNEGLSHIAEEMGSRYYENKYPAPAGRSNPNQLFPDSAEGFIRGDLFNSYAYLEGPDTVSTTLFSATGSLAERGAVWLFLRWLGDQKDSTIYGRLVQTSQTSVANVEDKAGETFSSLFGDFSIAVYTDSIPGLARSAVPPRFRFTSRNLRALYQAFFDANNQNGPSSLVPRPFPIAVHALPLGGSAQRTLLPGTMDFFAMQAPTPSSGTALSFTSPVAQPGCSAGPCTFDPLLKAQVGIFRLPALPPTGP